ncbi:MAG: putative rane spanning protein, partial [Rhodospirillales bacterium]|nr:putative rane spanning protein [Rhodospirillales bacterium]
APGPFAAHYVADGVEHTPGGFTALAAALSEGGALTLARAEAPMARMLMPPRAEADRLTLRVTQLPVAGATTAAVLARTGDGRTLARAEIAIPAGAREGEATLELPVEIRNQVVRLDLEPAAGAAGVMLLDERYRRRPVGLLASTETQADVPLIGDLYYLDRALAPYSEIRRGTLETLLARQLAVLVLADRDLSDAREREAVDRWVREGGTLIRFAGPRMAENPDPLLPVPLRAGERQLGGAMTWERAQPLAPFPDGSPFAGLQVPAEILVERQVLAEPSAQLSARSWARLADGTPLVTFETRGAGRAVLFHVTAQAEWSNLPLSGLFVDMLRRLVALSAGVAGNEGGAMLAPLESLDGFGRLGPAPPAAAAIAANRMEGAVPSPRQPPGWYGAPGQADDGAAYRRALNLSAGVAAPNPAGAALPSASFVTIGGVAADRDLGPWLLAAALLLLAIDLLVSLGLRGLLLRPVLRAAVLGVLLASPAMAQGDGSPSLATRLAYVLTGDAAVDETVRQGLTGLSDFVNRRSATALAEPLAVVPGQDELAFFPLIYWTILPDAPAPSATAVAALNGFMRNGGIILFDTRDEGSGEGFSPGARAALRRVTRELSVPPLAVMADDHVLRRSFYLLQEVPGRFTGGQVWVARDGDRANDSVSPVIIGGHDWAAAWAVDARGTNPHAVIPGGARQRILAYRFGMNLVIYALTGNYKGDQVHVPAILERLGN